MLFSCAATTGTGCTETFKSAFALMLRLEGNDMSNPKRILFVCVENSNRSQMAEAFARIHGGEKIEAYSAGSRPSGRVNPKAVDAMRELGYDLSQHLSKSLDEIPDVQYDLVATMGCGDECPFVRAKRHEDWNIPDPKNMSPDQFREVRDTIEAKIKALLSQIGA